LQFLRNKKKTIRAVFTEIPPVIDGIISEGEWTAADTALDFIQMEPRKGMPATEPTTAHLLFDNQFIYVAMICYHSNTDEIVARIQQRDELSKNDDIITVLLGS